MLYFREIDKKASWMTFVPFLFKSSYKQEAVGKALHKDENNGNNHPGPSGLYVTLPDSSNSYIIIWWTREGIIPHFW